MSENITDSLLEHVFNTKFEDIDDFTINRAKQRLIDAVGVFAIGNKGAVNSKVIDMMYKEGGCEEALVYTYGIKVPAETAAFLNSLLLRSFDYEAIDAEAVMEGVPTTAAHISSTTIPTVLAVADQVGASGKDVLRALVLADDIVARALNASHFMVHEPFDSNGTANALGATIAVGLLYGFDKEQMKDAITLAVNQMSGTMQNVFEKKVVFKLPNAIAARASIFAAKLAKEGFGPGLNDPVAGDRAMFQSFYAQPVPEEMLYKLGEKYVADSVIKPWPCCRATHAAIHATKDALKGRTLTADEVESMVIDVSFGVKKFVGEGFEFGMDKSYQGAFSIDFLCSTFCLYGKVNAEYEEACNMLKPELGELIAKTEVVPTLPPEAGANVSHCTITLKDGTVLKGDCDYPYGDIFFAPMSEEDFYEKFWDNIEYGQTISKENAQKLIDGINALEDVANVSDLLQLMK